MSLAQLQSVTTSFHMPQFVAKQMMQWIYKKMVVDIEQMTNISKDNRNRLKEKFEVGAEMPIHTMVSKDGTEKYLFPTKNGLFVETVLIPDKDRNTLCVSTQVGCKMNCLFCQTGKQGFQGNLSVCDILAQIQWAIREKNIDNVVFMGQGEPADNIDNVLHAIEILTDIDGFAWSPKRITVSTVGLKKNFKKLIEQTKANIAISLHSPIHEQRMNLMPAEKQFGIEDIIKILQVYDFSHQRRLSFEYIMFKNVNDSMKHAQALIKLLKPLQCRMNLIRFHKIPDVELEGADEKTILNFRDFLTSHGLFTTIRASRGEDILAACGMLSTKNQTDINL